MINIFEKLKVDFEYYTGSALTGLAKAIGAGFSSRLSEFQGKLSWIERQAFIETADKDYLYLHAGCLLEPIASKQAVGSVVFFGDVGAIVPIGVELSKDGIEYKTTSESVVTSREFVAIATVVNGKVVLPVNTDIPSCTATVNGVSKEISSDASGVSFSSSGIVSGQDLSIVIKMSDEVAVKSVEYSDEPNAPLNTKLKTKVTIAGLNREVNVVAIDGGRSEETVEEYRVRVKFFLANPQAPFNVNNIKAALLESVPTVKNVWVKGGEEEDGKVKIFAVNKDGTLTTSESAQVVEVVAGIRPIHMVEGYINAGAPFVRVQDVVISDIIPSHDRMTNQVRKNIEYLFSGDMFERGMSLDEIESMVYRTEVDGERVVSFSVSEGQCVGEKYTLVKLGSVTFEWA